MGGDCTNYASQVMYAGTPGFDQQGTNKWYYSGYNSRSPSWTSVLALRGYLLSNRGEVGHYSGFLTSKTYLKTGDIVQLGNYHSVVVHRNNSGTIYVSAHTSAALNKPLSDYGNPTLTCIQLKWYSNNTSIWRAMWVGRDMLGRLTFETTKHAPIVPLFLNPAGSCRLLRLSTNGSHHPRREA